MISKVKKMWGSTSRGIDCLIVGLGNPGSKYSATRHNVGFMAIDYFSDSENIPLTKQKYNALFGTGTVCGKKIAVIKPLTYMNRSGESVVQFSKFYKLSPQQVIVVFDDVALDIGRMRIRRDGSAGGHNGVSDIISHLSSGEFPRIKIGVGKKPHPDMDLADWVLGKIPPKDQKIIGGLYSDISDALKLMILGETDKAMAKFN